MSTNHMMMPVVQEEDDMSIMADIRLSRTSDNGAVRMAHYNPYNALENSSDGHSDASVDTNTIFDTPPQRREQAMSGRFAQSIAVHKTPSHPMRRMTFDTNGASPAFTTPIHTRLRADTSNTVSYPSSGGIPLSSNGATMNGTPSWRLNSHAKTSSRFNPSIPTTPHSCISYECRDTLHNSTPSRSTGRPSVGSSSRGPNLQGIGITSTLPGIPELLSVQEFAYRQGQQNHGNPSDRIAPSPFAEQFDAVWTEHYKLGKAAGGQPRSSSDIPCDTSLQGMNTWAVLIDPYTQDLQNSSGVVASYWTYGICNNALNSMRACIMMVCRRKGKDEWKKIVCDVPMPIQHALGAFPDLQERYEELKADANEALAGGLPMGYYGWYH